MAVLVCGLLWAPGWAAPPSAEPAASTPTWDAVRAAADAVAADPAMPGIHKEKTLRLRTEPRVEEQKKKGGEHGGLPEWLIGLVYWISEAGRVFVWGVGALLLGLLAVGFRQWIRVRGEGHVLLRMPPLPSHVRDLDIRPESLPAHIGAAARELWQRGEHRAALSLLYRGALSRLVHADGLPIRAASTEGECVALAAGQLPAARGAYFGRLVQAWQLAVYGGRLPESSGVLSLCAEFDTHLGAPAAAEPNGGAR